MNSEESKTHDSLLDLIEKHTEQDDRRFESIENKLDVIKDNHLAHVQKDMAEQSVNITKVTTNVDWLLRYHWIVATAAIGALIAGVVNLVK